MTRIAAADLIGNDLNMAVALAGGQGFTSSGRGATGNGSASRRQHGSMVARSSSVRGST